MNLSGLIPYVAPSPTPEAPPAPAPTPAPPPRPGSIGQWYAELQAQTQEPPKRASGFDSAISGLRQNAEGAAMAALLAFIDTDLGGLDLGGRLPLDWVAAVGLYALSIRDAHKPDGFALDLRALGQSATSIATYRMVHKWRTAQKALRAPAVSQKPMNAESF